VFPVLQFIGSRGHRDLLTWQPGMQHPCHVTQMFDLRRVPSASRYADDVPGDAHSGCRDRHLPQRRGRRGQETFLVPTVRSAPGHAMEYDAFPILPMRREIAAKQGKEATTWMTSHTCSTEPVSVMTGM
jgi:hypothetical protein